MKIKNERIGIVFRNACYDIDDIISIWYDFDDNN
jgi:hypothetical protein